MVRAELDEKTSEVPSKLKLVDANIREQNRKLGNCLNFIAENGSAPAALLKQIQTFEDTLAKFESEREHLAQIAGSTRTPKVPDAQEITTLAKDFLKSLDGDLQQHAVAVQQFLPEISLLPSTVQGYKKKRYLARVKGSILPVIEQRTTNFDPTIMLSEKSSTVSTWWRRRGSNPGPKSRYDQLYRFSVPLQSRNA